MARELEAVLSTGHYQFIFASASDGLEGAVELIYQPSLSVHGEECPSPSATAASEVVSQQWSKEQINDFVGKLGFLDSEGGVGEQINRFLHLNQVRLAATWWSIRRYLAMFVSKGYVTICSTERMILWLETKQKCTWFYLSHRSLYVTSNEMLTESLIIIIL